MSPPTATNTQLLMSNITMKEVYDENKMGALKMIQNCQSHYQLN